MKKTLLLLFTLLGGVISSNAATTLWENAEGVTVNWNGDVTVAKDKLTELKIGDILTISVKDVTVGATTSNWTAQVSLRDGWWNTLTDDHVLAESDTKSEFIVTGEILSIIQARGLMISGKGFKATKIEVSDGTYTGSIYSVWLGNTTGKPSISNNIFKMANGGYNDNNVWKNGIKAGDIIYISATAIDGYTGDKWFNICYNEDGWPSSGMDIVNTSLGFVCAVKSDNVEKLMSTGIVINQAGYTLTQVEINPTISITFPADKTLISYSPSYGIELDVTDVDGLTAYAVSSVTSTSVKLSETKGVYYGGHGYILEGTAGATYNIPVVESAPSDGTNLLFGTADNTLSVEANTKYVLYNGKFCLFTGTEIPAHKAYLDAPDASANELTLNFGDDDATAIKNIKVGTEDNVYYDLQGRRVLYPTKGLYIVNGKKVIVK